MSHLEIHRTESTQPASFAITTHPPPRDERSRTLSLRGWTGEYLQIRDLSARGIRVWHPDGSYFGRLIADAAQTDEAVSGTVFGPGGVYVADAIGGRLRVDSSRLRASANRHDYALTEFDSPGNISPLERRWPRRERPPHA